MSSIFMIFVILFFFFFLFFYFCSMRYCIAYSVQQDFLYQILLALETHNRDQLHVPRGRSHPCRTGVNTGGKRRRN